MLADATFWAAIALFVFIGFMIYLKVPGQITAALDRRSETIRNELEEARQLREEAQALLAEYQRKAREATQEAEEIVDQARRDAELYAADARQRIDEYVTRQTRLAEQKIGQAEAQALQEVRARSADIAIAAAERILAEKVQGAEAERLVKAAISDVRAKLN